MAEKKTTTKKTTKPKTVKTQTTKMIVDEFRNLLSSGRVKLSDLQLPKYAKYRDAIEDYYGQTMQLIASDETGSLMRLFSDALDPQKGYTDVRFQKELEKTQWFLKYDASNREYQRVVNDPAAAMDLATKRKNIVDEVQAQALEDTGKRLDDATAASIAEDLLKNNYNDWQSKITTRVRSAISKMSVSDFGGKVLATSTSIRAYARSMGISVNDSTISKYLSDILAGNTTLDAVQGEFRKMALPYYPQFADRINAGDTIEDITSPYRNMIASMLEIEPDSIGFDIGGSKMDPILLKALSGEGGKPVGLYDLRKMIKQDSRWQYTRNAEEEYAGLTTKLMRMFGAGV